MLARASSLRFAAFALMLASMFVLAACLLLHAELTPDDHGATKVAEAGGSVVSLLQRPQLRLARVAADLGGAARNSGSGASAPLSGAASDTGLGAPGASLAIGQRLGAGVDLQQGVGERDGASALQKPVLADMYTREEPPRPPPALAEHGEGRRSGFWASQGSGVAAQALVGNIVALSRSFAKGGRDLVFQALAPTPSPVVPDAGRLEAARAGDHAWQLEEEAEPWVGYCSASWLPLEALIALIYFLLIVRSFPRVPESAQLPLEVSAFQQKGVVSAVCDRRWENVLLACCCTSQRAAHTMHSTGVLNYWPSCCFMTMAPCLTLWLMHSCTNLKERLGTADRHCCEDACCALFCGCCVVAQDAIALDMVAGTRTTLCGVEAP